MTKSYKAKVSVRTERTYCVRVPKRFIDSGEYNIGDIVDVTICKLDELNKKEDDTNDRQSNQKEGECSSSDGIQNKSIRKGEEDSFCKQAESDGFRY